jgi:HK97 gp10 family phage protein
VDATGFSRLAGSARGVVGSTRRRFDRVENDTARDIAVSAKRRAPVLTGELRAGIRVQGSLVESTADHSGFQEYGTSRMDPNPYMNPAADEHEEAFARDAERAAAELVERALW